MEKFLILKKKKKFSGIDLFSDDIAEDYYLHTFMKNVGFMNSVEFMFSLLTFARYAPCEISPIVILSDTSGIESASAYTTVGAAFKQLKCMPALMEEHGHMDILLSNFSNDGHCAVTSWVYDIQLLADLVIEFDNLHYYPDTLCKIIDRISYNPRGALELLYRSIDRDMYLNYNNSSIVEMINYLTRSNYPLQDPHGACLFAWYIIYKVMDYVNFKAE